MEITVQWVRTSWTKRSRGGAEAARRNGCPVGFRLPGPSRDASEPQAHVVRMREEHGFEPVGTFQDLDRVGVRLRESEGRLRVHPRIDPLFGLPPRRRRPPAVGLRPGQWVRWQLNYRFSSAAGMQDWAYWLDTCNIAYGPVAPDVFLGTPDFVVDEQGPVR